MTENNLKNKRKIGVILAVMIIALVLILGPGLAFNVLSTQGTIAYSPGTRDINVTLQIQKYTNEVVQSFSAKLSRMPVDANEAVIESLTLASVVAGTNIYVANNEEISDSVHCVTSDYPDRYFHMWSANGYSYTWGYGYSYGDLNNLGYGYSSTGYGWGYDNYGMTNGTLDCTFTFEDVNQGVYIATRVYANDALIGGAGLDKVIGLIDLSQNSTLKFVEPSTSNGILRVQLDVGGTNGTDYNLNSADEYVGMTIDPTIADNPSTATTYGSFFAFGPTDSNFADANLTMYYAGVSGVDGATNLVSRLGVYHNKNSVWSLVSAPDINTTAKTVKVGVSSFSGFKMGLIPASTSSSSSSSTTTSDLGTTTVLGTYTSPALVITPAEVSTLLEGSGLSADEIQAYVDAAALGGLSIERELVVEKIVSTDGTISYKSTFTITFKNTTGKALKELKIVEVVPKNVASNASQITSTFDYKVLLADPILEFTIPSVAVGGTSEVTYSVNKQVTQAQFDEYSSPAYKYTFASTGTDTNGTVVTPDANKPTGTTDTGKTGTTTTGTDWSLLILVVLVLVVLVAGYFLLQGKSNKKK
ncbi:MAG: hypothetical protein WC462_02245 [archaeon]